MRSKYQPSVTSSFTRLRDLLWQRGIHRQAGNVLQLASIDDEIIRVSEDITAGIRFTAR